MGALDLLRSKDTNELDELAVKCLLRTAEELSSHLPAHTGDKLWQLIDTDFEAALVILSQRGEEHPIATLLRKVASMPFEHIENDLRSEVMGYLLDSAPLGYPDVKVEGRSFLLNLVVDHCLNLIHVRFSKLPVSELDPFYLYAFYVFTLCDGIDEALSQTEGKSLHFAFGREELTIPEFIDEWGKQIRNRYPTKAIELTQQEEDAIDLAVLGIKGEKAIEAVENLRGEKLTLKSLEKARSRGREKLKDLLSKVETEF